MTIPIKPTAIIPFLFNTVSISISPLFENVSRYIHATVQFVNGNA